MASVLQTVIDRLAASVQANEPWYTPGDLLEAGYPSYLVARMRAEMDRKLIETVRLPESKWADASSASVKNAWDTFMEAMCAERRVPAMFLRAVLKTGLEDSIEQIVNPRTAVAETLFGTSTELDAQTLTERAGQLILNAPLAQALVRHMDRRKILVMGKAEAIRLITSVDEILTRSFTADNWTLALSPLFELAPGGADPAWIAAFFRNRGMASEAEAFDEVTTVVSAADVSAILSRPRVEEYQFEEFEIDPEETSEPEPEPEPEPAPKPAAKPSAKREADNMVLNDLYASELARAFGTRLSAMMVDIRPEVTAVVFRGDDVAFDIAMAEIARFTSYAEAGRYIKRNILDRYRVDLYSDEAALFLDRIQSYFLENT
jgi:hypothetical protein